MRALVRATASEVRLSEILPPAEGKTKQVSLRIPEKLLERIERISKSTGHERAEVCIHFLRWATQEWELEQEKKKAAKR